MAAQGGRRSDSLLPFRVAAILARLAGRRKAWWCCGVFVASHHAGSASAALLGRVATLHRLGIVHRDIKPDNVHIDRAGELRLLDLGVAAADAEDLAEINNPGTPSYMAPELFAGSTASESSDLYACGVTLYELLTRKYPYGEIEPFQRPHFGAPVTPTRYRPDTPAWLEAVLLKACARAPKDRFETAEEFLLALERGASRPLATRRHVPLVERNPRLALKLVAGASLLLNLVLMVLVVWDRDASLFLFRVAALVGVAPYNCDSGTLRGRRSLDVGRGAFPVPASRALLPLPGQRGQLRAEGGNGARQPAVARRYRRHRRTRAGASRRGIAACGRGGAAASR